jgi:hypothetical protein
MRLDWSPSRAPDIVHCRRCLPPLTALCGHESGIPLPLSVDQPNWIECEYCGLDNEIPAGPGAQAVVVGSVPTRFF